MTTYPEQQKQNKGEGNGKSKGVRERRLEGDAIRAT
jgi:hypothetical protein